MQICESIGLDKSRAFRAFLIDFNVYGGEYNQVVNLLLHKKSKNLKSLIQLISVSLMLHDYNSTLKYCLDAVENLPSKHTPGQKNHVSSVSMNSPRRQLQFFALSKDQVLSYVIDVIILCLKDRIILSLKPSDLGIGHLLVLSQFDWPNQVQLFLTCMSFIRNSSKSHAFQSHPKFVYPCFFNYIFIPDVIEEFMNLLEMKDVTLELKPLSGSSLGAPLKTSSKGITTRGVNKGVKEEIKSSLISQMKISKTQVPNELFIDFINREIRAFLACLNK